MLEEFRQVKMDSDSIIHADSSVEVAELTDEPQIFTMVVADIKAQFVSNSLGLGEACS